MRIESFTKGSSDDTGVRVYEDLDALRARAGEWNELVAGSVYPNVFLTWEWLSQWWRSFGRDKRAHIIVLSGDSGRWMGLCPLWRSEKRSIAGHKVRTLGFLGDGGPTFPEYLGPILQKGHTAALADRLADHLLEKYPEWDILRFPGVAPDDAGTMELIARLKGRVIVTRSAGPACPYFSLPESYEHFLLGLSRHGRQRERRLLRQAHKDCQIRCDLVRSEEELDFMLPTVIELHRSSRARHAQLSPFDNPDYLRFHEGVMRQSYRAGNLRLYLLRFDGTAVAFQYGFVYAQKYYDFQSGFDARYEKRNAGDVLLQLVIQALIEERVKEFDFLRGEHAYKEKFARSARQTEAVTVFRRKGLLYVQSQARRLVARVWHKLKWRDAH